MARMYLAVLFCLACSHAYSLECAGKFKQTVVVKGSEWTWSYSTSSYSIYGETLLHPKHDSFSIIGREDESCIRTWNCSITEMICAVSHALAEPKKTKLGTGRMQITSFGLYQQSLRGLPKCFLAIEDCRWGYTQYYREMLDFWRGRLTELELPYEVKKLHPREIPLRKPASLGNSCFEKNTKVVPKSWSDIDFHPVVTLVRK